MDISLREWLIIGGVLIVILILVDGWRRVSANRSRLRLEIDRTLSELAEDNPHNPELPNGGARVRDAEGRLQSSRQQNNESRVEPGFAEDPFATAPTAEPTLAEMDPLFDDIPPVSRARAQAAATSRPTSAVKPSAVESSASATETRTEARQEPPQLRVPVDPVSPELSSSSGRQASAEVKEPDLEQPIPVLFDEVDPQDNIASEDQVAPQGHVAPQDNPELPDDTLAAYRQAVDAADGQRFEPEISTEPDTAVEPRSASEPLWSPAQGLYADTRTWSEQAEVPHEIRSEAPSESMVAAMPNEIESAAAEQPETQTSPRPTNKPARGLKSKPDPEQVLIITVVGRNGKHLPGPALDRIVTACGMEWGDMAIYHRPEDNSPDAPIQFSMANAVAPGTFDPDHLEELATPAVTFFMSMAEPTDTMTAYECMLATAETLAKHLDGDLLDEDRSVMRPQTKEHYRERIRDFEMHKRQRRAN
jgi:cell division protein ZipA